MALEPWQLVVLACTGGGVAAAAARLCVAALGSLQARRLVRDGGALRGWWDVICELPSGVLTPPLRRTLGRILVRRLERATRLQAEHPFLASQREEIGRFVGGASFSFAAGRPYARSASAPLARERKPGSVRPLPQPLREPLPQASLPRPIPRQASRQRQLAALRDLQALLWAAQRERLIARAELARAEAAVAGAIAEMELLRTQPATLGPAYLRRVSRAIAGTALPLVPAQPSRDFPTQ